MDHIRAAKATLTIAVRDNRDLTKFDVDIAEARFNLRDVRGILSHTLVPYTQQTGRAVLKEHDRVRQIVAASTQRKRLLGQERLPLAGPNKYWCSTFHPGGYEGRGEVGGGGVMERNVVSLETAKKLKAVGFPRVSMWHYSERMDPPDELFFTQSSGSTQFDIAAPTAQEIADQLPGLWSVMNSKVTSNYHAAYHDSGGDRINAAADTLAETLANLLLKLVESGDLKFER